MAGRTSRLAHRWAQPISLLLSAVLVALSVGYLLHLSRRTSFFFDEWSWIATRRGWAPHNFLVSHNGHFVALPVLIYHLLFLTVGLHAYLPYRLVLMAFQAGLCLTLHFYARPRVGPCLAVVAVGAMCLIGPAYQDLIWPFQIAFIGALLFGLGAFLCLDGDSGRRRDLLALVLLLAAITCSGTGLAMLAGAVVRVVGRREWHRWWVVTVPAVIFGLWYLRYGGNPSQRSSTGRKFDYFVNEFRAGVGGLTGHPATQAIRLAEVLAVIVVLLVVLRLVLAGIRRSWPVELVSTVVVGMVLLGLTAISRAGYNDFGASRYLYSTGFVVILLLIEALRGVRWTVPISVVLAVATALAVSTGLHTLRINNRSLSNVDTYVRADLAAIDQLKNPPPTYVINPRLVPTLTVRQYLSIRRDLGTPAMPFAAVPRQSIGVRNDVDRVLRQAGGLRVVAGSVPALSPTPHAVGPRLTTLPDQPGCLLLHGPVGVNVLLGLPAAGLSVLARQSPVTVLVSRFGPTRARLAAVPAGGWHRLLPARDESSARWTVQLISSDPVELCRPN